MSLRKLTLSSGANLACQAATALSVLFLSPIIIEGLGVEQYGTWLLALSLVAYLGFLDLGLEGTALRFLSVSGKSDDPEEMRQQYRWFRRFYWTVGGLVVSASAAFLAWGDLLVGGGNPPVVLRLVTWLGVATGIAFLCRPYFLLLKSHLLYHRVAWISLGRLGCFLVAILLWRRTLTLDLLLTLHLVLTAAEGLAAAWIARPLVPPAPAQQRAPASTRRSIRSHAGKNVLAGLADLLRNSFDTQLVAAFVSLAAVTQYGVGMRLPRLFFDLLTALFGSPLIAAFGQLQGSQDQKALESTLRLSLRTCAGIAFGGATAIFVLAPPFIHRWLGPGFDDAIAITRIIIFPMALLGAAAPLNCFLIAASRHGRIVALSLVGSALNLILSLVLVQSLGVRGVVVATALEFLFIPFALAWVSASVTGWSPWSYVREIVVQPALVFALLGWPAAEGIVRWIAPHSFLQIGTAAALLGPCLLGLAWFGVLGKEARDLLQSRLLPVWSRSVRQKRPSL